MFITYVYIRMITIILLLTTELSGCDTREAEERAEAEKLALERAAQEKAAMEKAIAEREERARAAAAAPRRGSAAAAAAAAASPTESGDDSGPPLYMPVQHRPGDHGAVPSVSPRSCFLQGPAQICCATSGDRHLLLDKWPASAS